VFVHEVAKVNPPWLFVDLVDRTRAQSFLPLYLTVQSHVSLFSMLDVPVAVVAIVIVVVIILVIANVIVVVVVCRLRLTPFCHFI
jgi:hypothetical protein